MEKNSSAMRIFPLKLVPQLLPWCLLALAMLLAVAGCSDSISREETERVIAARAPDLIGPADHYRVEARNIGPREVETIRITGVGVKPDPNLTIDPLVLTLRHVRYQIHPFHVLAVGEATFEGRVSESALNEYLLHQQRTESNAVKNLRVTLERGVVRVDAHAAVAQLTIPIMTSGWVRVDDGQRFHYTAEKLRIMGVGVPVGIQQLLTAMVNPLVDLSGLRFTPHVQRVIPEAGTLVFAGTATLRKQE